MDTTTAPRHGALALGALAVLAGCAVAPTAPSVAVLPGTQKSQAQFQGDVYLCQQQAQAQVAPVAQAANDQALASAAVGTVLGAAVGALLGSPYYAGQSAAWGAGSGLLLGGAMGGSAAQASSYGMQQRYDAAYVQCMYAQGNQVPVPAGYRRAATVSMPPPPIPRAPSYPPPNTLAPSNLPPKATAPGYAPPNTLPPSYPPPNTRPPSYPPPDTPPPPGTLVPG
jgi:hypothetical protein